MKKNIKWKNTNNDSIFEELSQEKYKSKYSHRQDSDAQRNAVNAIYNDPKNEEAKQKVFDALERARENGSCSRGGQTNVETGHIQALGKKYWKGAWEASLEIVKCEVCDQSVNTGNYAKWHGKKCKHNQIIEYFDQLPNDFTRKQAVQLCNDLGYPKNFARKIVNDGYMDLIECIHKGTWGSGKDVPIYRKVK